MWNNVDNNAFGYIELTVGGKTFKAGGKTSKAKGNGDEQELHSGFLIAGYGNAGEGVASLQLKFLAAPLDSAVVTSIKFRDDINEWNKQKK